MVIHWWTWWSSVSQVIMIILGCGGGINVIYISCIYNFFYQKRHNQIFHGYQHAAHVDATIIAFILHLMYLFMAVLFVSWQSFPFPYYKNIISISITTQRFFMQKKNPILCWNSLWFCDFGEDVFLNKTSSSSHTSTTHSAARCEILWKFINFLI